MELKHNKTKRPGGDIKVDSTAPSSFYHNDYPWKSGINLKQYSEHTNTLL